MKQGTIEQIAIDKIIPYWRNPRMLSSDAVEAVRSSIEAYGYAQPIVVDSEYVIIIGHTRYSAMRRMGVEEVEVMIVDYLSAQKVKQLRIIDNRSAEYAFWDFDKLQEEIADQDSALMREMFPEILGEIDDAAQTLILNGEGQGTPAWDDVDMNVEFVCPKCFHEWATEITRNQILDGVIR